MSWIDNLNNSADVGMVQRFQPVVKQPKQQQPKKKKSLWEALIPTVGSIGGGAAGAAIGTALLPGIGTLLGAGLGSALGGGGGKVAENAVEGNKLSSGVAGEAALSGVLGAGPLRLGKFGLDVARGAKTIGTTEKALETINAARGIPIKSIENTNIGTVGAKVPVGATPKQIPLDEVGFINRFKGGADLSARQITGVVKTFSQTGSKDPLNLVLNHLALNATKGETRTIVNNLFPAGLDNVARNSLIRDLQKTADPNEIKTLLQSTASRIDGQIGNVKPSELSVSFGDGTQRQTILPAKIQPTFTREVPGKSRTLADVLQEAGGNASGMSLTRSLGNKLTGVGDNLAVKSFRLTPSQLGNFKNKFGEDASQVIKRYKLTGKDAGAITDKAINPLQGEFDAIAGKIPNVPKEQVQNAFKAKYEPLLNSAVEDNKSIGQQLKNQTDSLLKKYGDNIPGSELGKIRQEFDSLVSYSDKTANPARYGVNKRSADAIRATLQQAADGAGLKSSKGLGFKEVGKELSKLRQLEGNVSKQEMLGRGSLPFSLGNTPGAVIGSGAGPAGAMGGYVANALVNSGAGRRAIAETTEKAGQRLLAKAGSTNPYGLKSLATRLAPVGLADALGSQLSNNSSQTTNTIPTSTNIPTNANISSPYQDASTQSSNMPSITPQRYQQAVVADLQKTGGKNLDTLKALYDQFGPQQAPKLNASQLTQANNANSGLADIGNIAQEIANNPKVLVKDAIPGGSISRRLTGTTNYDAAKQNVVDVIARLRSGAAITQDEANRYMGLLPGVGDTQETALNKLQRLQSLLSSFSNPQAAQTDAASIASALGA